MCLCLCYSDASEDQTETDAAEPTTLIPPTPSKDDAAPSTQTPQRRKAKAKHKVGFDSSWMKTRPWLYHKTEIDEELGSSMAMYCRICQTHNTSGLNGSKVWNTEGCVTLRLDKVTAHERSDQHQTAIRLETCKQLGIEKAFQEQDRISEKEFSALTCAMKCLHFLIKHNIPHTTVYKDFIDFARDELKCPDLQYLCQGKNATYTSHRTADEFLDNMVEEIEEVVHSKIKSSPAYAIMTDEATDVSNRKHLVFCAKYVDQDTGDVNVDFVKDVQVDNGLADTIFNETKQVIEQDLNVDGFMAFGSDGCNTMIGRRNGVATKLKEMKPEIVTIHCHNHRLALAAKDSFESIPAFRNTDDTLSHLFKYYHNSAVRTKSLEKIQKLLDGDFGKNIKGVSHTRWLSHINAVSSLRDTYIPVLMDLENSVESGRDHVTLGSGPSARGLLKKLKSFKFMHIIHFLCDALKPLTQLALTFERQVVDLSIVYPRLQTTINTLKKLKTVDGPNTRKVEELASEAGITYTAQELTSAQTAECEFLDKLVENVEKRLDNAPLIDSMAIFQMQEQPDSMYGNDEIVQLAEHFNLNQDDTLMEWDSFKDQVFDISLEKLKGPTDIIKILMKLQQTVGDSAPNVRKLACVAAVLPVSTAEVERVFSDVNRTVTDIRNRLQVETTHKLLMIHRNDTYLDIGRAARKWLSKGKRRICAVDSARY